MDWREDLAAPTANGQYADDAGSLHSIRSGAWALPPTMSTSACRVPQPTSHTSVALGFRILLATETTAASGARPKGASRPAEPARATATPSPPPPAVAPFDAAQAKRHQEFWAKHLGVPVETTNSIGQTLVLIPPSVFTMGAGDNSMRVTLTKPYWIGRTEVTQGEWRTMMGTDPWKGNEFPDRSKYWTDGDDVAVSTVSWDDAKAFCDRLTSQERFAGTIRQDQEYRLPTEAEWENACRAGTVTNYSFGNDSAMLGDFAWFGAGWDEETRRPIPGGNTRDAMHPQAVGTKKPNHWGVFDVHGNVDEWCLDVLPRKYGPAATNPLGETLDSHKMARGGSWYSPVSIFSHVRLPPLPSSMKMMGTGFRIVLADARAPATKPAHGPDETPSNIAASPAGTAAPPTAVVPFEAAQAKKQQEAWAKHLGVPVETINSIGQTLVVIPPGRFRNRRPPDGSVEVSITKPFLIGQTEVTQGQWRAVMDTAPWKDREYVTSGDDVAASYVSWHDAVAFCRKLTARERDSGALGLEQEYRLPTEAEWEHACRAGTDTERFFRQDVDPKAPDPEGETLTGKYAWFSSGISPPTPGGSVGSELFAHAVKQKLPNAWGLYDVNGNVFEWVSDWYVERRPFIAGPLTDPQGPEPDRDAPGGIPQKTVKGGNWVDEWKSLTSSGLYHFPPKLGRYSVGFRVLRMVGAPKKTSENGREPRSDDPHSEACETAGEVVC